MIKTILTFSHENLINPYTDVPTGVEILDLSINKISAIEDDDFKVRIRRNSNCNFLMIACRITPTW